VERAPAPEGEPVTQTRSTEVARLRRQRPRNRFLRASVALLAALAAGAWLSGEIRLGELASPRRLANLRTFLTVDAVPFPLREEGVTAGGLLAWAGEIWQERGAEATLATLWIAVAAIFLAGTVALFLGPLAARTLATCEPYLLGRSDTFCPLWRLARGLTRFTFVAMRAIPEYVWAFFLVSLLPIGAWPAVLALAVHNGGILGRLYGETLENLEPRSLRALRMLGGGRTQLFTLAALPLALPRFLLYFFYRFETCVREATVLGMLGIASLGYEIADARSKHFYDEMLLLVGFGVCIVLLGDLTSHLARGWVRRAP